ncbi:MAG: YbaB/EbfC family nucleoid-associated protein [Treponema sp.]|nr:YbaB/EbfC family nucleoid-associated protein [Spirochaetia bacterium]MDD6295524.1 YbaB/EbfC family nucleoid-associated protein [Treponema sp.]MDD7451641.1 YbaB/EbfC family nucleoid-associated protein [Treponema sp.]MDY2923453.1 YbaB/EbfC family nucleoid-associated protein [Treponema sp.]MDY5683521.1 YbaB/EbfC family nucleoid-associated protein [Treponema sp.]
MNPFDLLKNPQAIQAELEKVKNQLAQITVTGSSGGNMVQVTLNGNMEMLSIKLDPLCVDNRDVPMLQDLIVAAHHDAMSKIQEEIKDRLGPMIGSFPGLGF